MVINFIVILAFFMCCASSTMPHDMSIHKQKRKNDVD